MTTQMPQQLALGGWYDIMSDLRAYADYSLTQYNQVQKIGVATELTAADLTPVLGGGAATTVAVINKGITLNYRNQNVYRLGFEYTGVASWTPVYSKPKR